MKGLKKTALFTMAIFFICFFTGVSFGFNPQPEPPRDKPQFNLPATQKVFDPQPEPPREPLKGDPGFDPDPDPAGEAKIIGPGNDYPMTDRMVHPPEKKMIEPPDKEEQVMPGGEAMEEEIPLQPKKRMIHPPEKKLTQPINQ